MKKLTAAEFYRGLCIKHLIILEGDIYDQAGQALIAYECERNTATGLRMKMVYGFIPPGFPGKPDQEKLGKVVDPVYYKGKPGKVKKTTPESPPLTETEKGDLVKLGMIDPIPDPPLFPEEPKAKKKVSTEDLAEALKIKDGDITAAAKTLGITKSIIYKRIKKVPHLKKVITEYRKNQPSNKRNVLYSFEQIRDALIKHNGCSTAASKEIGCSAWTIYYRTTKNPELKKLLTRQPKAGRKPGKEQPYTKKKPEKVIDPNEQPEIPFTKKFTDAMNEFKGDIYKASRAVGKLPATIKVLAHRDPEIKRCLEYWDISI